LIRHCACGNPIRLRDSICKKCRIEYGSDPSGWPEWVTYLVQQEQREVDRKRLHDFDLPFIDEQMLPNTKIRPTENFDKEPDELVWERQ